MFKCLKAPFFLNYFYHFNFIVVANVGDIGVDNEVIEPIAPVLLNGQLQGVEVFPDDDDMFPLGRF